MFLECVKIIVVKRNKLIFVVCMMSLMGSLCAMDNDDLTSKERELLIKRRNEEHRRLFGEDATASSNVGASEFIQEQRALEKILFKPPTQDNRELKLNPISNLLIQSSIDSLCEQLKLNLTYSFENLYPTLRDKQSTSINIEWDMIVCKLLGEACGFPCKKISSKNALLTPVTELSYEIPDKFHKLFKLLEKINLIISTKKI